MASWQEITDEINREIASSGPQGIDIVRRKKLKELSDITGRPTILYGVEMFNLQKINATQGDISIDLTDKDGFLEALRDITGDIVDVIIHSPGGSPEATESLVKLLRSRFTSIRYIVPSIAKSAATMLTMSGDEIILGNDAELGPTDPSDNYQWNSKSSTRYFETI
jgi:ClpP class serine protease